MPALAAIGAAVKIGGAIIQGARAKREAKRYRKQQKALNDKMNHLEANRQDIINPYDQVTSLASMATDLSNTFSNPMANLSVATQAAEMQIEQADISLANTLDTIRATGAGAGGATALAQAALKSKKGVAAGIEQQEAGNEKLRAQGEAQLQQRIAAEKQRIQGINISEGGREQNAMATGRAFEFSSLENRQSSEINRTYGQMQQANQNAAAARAQEGSAISSGMNALGGAISSGAFGGGSSMSDQEISNIIDSDIETDSSVLSRITQDPGGAIGVEDINDSDFDIYDLPEDGIYSENPLGEITPSGVGDLSPGIFATRRG
tara:strand:+ start:402 stop:1364 length:963 start_codon:yes stop_codon:yes gene_type:complete